MQMIILTEGLSEGWDKVQLFTSPSSSWPKQSQSSDVSIDADVDADVDAGADAKADAVSKHRLSDAEESIRYRPVRRKTRMWS